MSSGSSSSAGESVYDDLPDGVVVAGPDGVVTTVNRAASRILRVDAATLVGRQLAEALPLQDDAGRDWWACTRPFDGLASRVRQPEQQLTLAGDGDRRLLVTAGFVRAPDRALQRVVVSLRETAARARSERSGAELIAVMAHDLRSPLTSVKGFTATLLNKWERFGDEQKRLMLQTINADADRVARLITALLDVSRIDTGRLELRKQVVDVPAVVEREIAARVAAGTAAERLVLHSTGELGEVWADPDKLAQVLASLVDNALRHGAGTVTVTVSPHDGGVQLTIADEGDGVSDAARPRLFTKFWRGEGRSGSGLGLYVAKGVLDAHGGAITVGDAPGGGALVTVVLPAGTPSFAR